MPTRTVIATITEPADSGLDGEAEKGHARWRDLRHGRRAARTMDGATLALIAVDI